MRWGYLRAGLLDDLGLTSPAELAAEIGYSDVEHLAAALDGAPPRDDLMSALLHHYITTPVLYFVDRVPA